MTRRKIAELSTAHWSIVHSSTVTGLVAWRGKLDIARVVLIGSVNTSDTRRFAFNVQNTRRDSVYEAYDEAHPRAVSHP